MLVQADEDRAHLGAVDDLELVVPAQPLDVLRRQVGHHVDVPRKQRRDARGVGLDWRVGEVAHVTVVLAPPAPVDSEDDLLVRLPPFENVRAGAVRVARSIGFLARLVVLDVLRAVLFRPGFAHDAEVDDVPQQDRVRSGEDEIDRVIVDLPHLAHPRDVDLHRALRLADAAEREHHVVGRERRAVVKAHALSQVEAPLRRSDLLPARGERRLHVVVAVVARQSLIDVHRHGERRGMVLRMRVEAEDVVLRRPAKIRALGGKAAEQQGHEQRDESHGLLLYTGSMRSRGSTA